METQLSPEARIQQAAVVRDFISHPGMKLLADRLNKKLDLKRTEWLAASTPEEAEKIRQDSRSYAALMGILNEFLLRGEQAQRNQQASAEMHDGTKGRQ